jgi:hypothetical protein
VLLGNRVIATRVMIGTWNVAGQTPNEDVDLDQWLCTQEPADMYVLGWVPSQAMKMDLFT